MNNNNGYTLAELTHSSNLQALEHCLENLKQARPSATQAKELYQSLLERYQALQQAIEFNFLLKSSGYTPVLNNQALNQAFRELLTLSEIIEGGLV